VQVQPTFAEDAGAAAAIVSNIEKSHIFFEANRAALGIKVNLGYHVGNDLQESDLAAVPRGLKLSQPMSACTIFCPPW